MKKILIAIVLIYAFQQCGAFINYSNFYGYSQLDYSISNNKDNQAKFEITRFNLIGDFELNSNARFVADVELEHNLNATDKGIVGSIKFSQVWAEYSFMQECKLRAGKILTNFGLYNKIHDASPTYFSISSPLIYSRFAPNSDFQKTQRFFGKYMMGLEATGTIDLDNEGSQLEYSLMYGKGRNDFVDNVYVQSDNALSARLYFTPSFLRGLEIGGSFYTDRNNVGIAGAVNEIEVIPAVELQYEYKDFQLQSEAFFPSYKNSAGVDQQSLLSYLHLAYTIYDQFTPYTQLSYIKFDTNKDLIQSQFLLGLNYAVSTSFFLKGELQYNNNEFTTHKEEFGSLKASISIAF